MYFFCLQVDGPITGGGGGGACKRLGLQVAVNGMYL